jgi:predicted Zn-dependent protease with MMP-like domain
MNDKSQVESILNDIKLMVNNVIIKLSYQAEMYETADTKREADRYIAAYLERDTFNSYRSYPFDVLAKAGISNLNDLTEYSEDKRKIPREKRPEVLKAMRETVIKEYVEMNDYYRELIGKPSVNTPESEWIYLTDDEMAHYEIDEVRPIHDYPKEIQLKLERDLIPRLIEQYPERTYLQYMGSKSVNLVRARQARNFEIIFTDINLDNVFMRTFFETYDFAREYVMSMVYNKAFRDRYNLYDNYLGMHIMIMAIQRIIVDTIKMGIDRDFYDLVSIQKLFNVYKVPFFEDLPLDYQRTIVKNVNMLIRSKSTDKVLYDIANTLFYERVRIYKYFLVKERKFDKNGEPIFLYKENILDNPPEKFYISDENKVTYELAVQNDKLTTVVSSVPYAPESIYLKDDVTGDAYRLFMNKDQIAAEKVESKDQIFENVVMYNDKADKYILIFENGDLTTKYEKYDSIRVYDYENMFNVYFQATDILEQNVTSSLETKYNRYEYDEVVRDDVYWWDTEELKKELYERDYNFIDSKYISITVMQNLTKMLYETVYYLNLLVDHKNTTTPLEQRIFNADAMKTGTDYLYLNLDRLTTVPVSIFDTVIILCALVSKKNGMAGNIITKSPAQILSVLGFNFELNFDLIRENIKKYKRVFKNQEILKYLDLLDIRTVEDIDILFNNFRNFAEFCTEVISTTTDINEYKAYKELYKTITVRKDTTELFKMSNGEVATTYLEYLYDKLPYVAKNIEEMHKDKTGIYIEHIIGRLNELIPEIEYLNTMNGTNNNIVQAIVGLINFFKSYTVDLRTLNILYMFDDKMFNKIFMIDDPRLFIQIFPNESLGIYNDTVKPIVKFDKYDNLIIYDPTKYRSTLNPVEYVGERDEIEKLTTNLKTDDTIELSYKDVMALAKSIEMNMTIDLRIHYNYTSEILHKDKYSVEHMLKLYNSLAIYDVLELDYKDIIKEFINECDIKNNVDFEDLFKFHSRLNKLDNYNLKDTTMGMSHLFRQMDNFDLQYNDEMKYMNVFIPGSSVYLNDSVKVIYDE